jgi:hypothetical protein
MIGINDHNFSNSVKGNRCHIIKILDRMFIEYKVYRRVSDLKPFISRDELPSCQMIGKKKFVGKKSKNGGCL